MTHDRSKYMPDVAKVLKDCDPATFDERERKALEKVREAGLLERLTPEPAKRVSAPSPWAKDGGAGSEVDKGELPSAMAPAVEEEPVTKAAKPEKAARRWPATWIVVLGCIGFMVAVALLSVVVMLGRMRELTGTAAPAPSVVVVPSAAVVPSATASAVPSTTATEVPSALPLPSTPATTRTIPAPSAPPRKPPIKPRDTHGDPPRTPVQTAAPIEPQQIAPSPPPVKNPIEGDRVFGN